MPPRTGIKWVIRKRYGVWIVYIFNGTVECFNGAVNYVSYKELGEFQTWQKAIDYLKRQ